jgi:type IV pilus assembly protein PilQ
MTRLTKVTLIILLLLLTGIAIADTNQILKKGNISLTLSGVPLADALNMIAEQNDLNLVISGSVSGDVSLNLTDVSVETALDAILTAHGYAYYVTDGVVVVKSTDVDVAAELVSKTVTLKYVDPVTAQKALNSRLSDKGQVIILNRQTAEGDTKDSFHPNRLFLTERPNNIDKLMGLITEIDTPERMIMIECKIIETKVDNSTKLGFQWPTSFGAKISGVDDGTTSSSSSTTTTTANASVARSFEAGTWTWGTLSVDQVNFVLDALMRNGNSKILSNPHVTTAENYEAEISTQTIIPIQTINRFSEGAVIQDIVTFQDEEVGIRVLVTPRINEEGKITLDVNPVIEDIIGYTGPPDNQKPIKTSRTIKTRVTVADGETLALGGLIKEDEIITRQRVPLLGQIPLLGNILFSHKSVEKNTTDLMILITPKVL